MGAIDPAYLDELPAQRDARRRLMRQAGELRSRLFPSATDEAWRRERLYRYLYWREHREHCPFTVVGAWHTPDIEREIERWQDYERGGLGEKEVFELLCAELEQRHGKAWQEALEEGTSPLLATVRQPIWHEATGALLPALLGPLPICRADTYPGQQHLGWQYQYDYEGAPQKASLTLYDKGFEGLRDGLGDPRLKAEFEQACRDIRQLAEANGRIFHPDSAVGPVVETLHDPAGREIEFAGAYVEITDKDGVRRGEAISMRVFRANFLKLRYTRFNVNDGDETADQVVDAINSDVADFVGHFT